MTPCPSLLLFVLLFSITSLITRFPLLSFQPLCLSVHVPVHSLLRQFCLPVPLLTIHFPCQDLYTRRVFILLTGRTDKRKREHPRDCLRCSCLVAAPVASILICLCVIGARCHKFSIGSYVTVFQGTNNLPFFSSFSFYSSLPCFFSFHSASFPSPLPTPPTPCSTPPRLPPPSLRYSHRLKALAAPKAPRRPRDSISPAPARLLPPRPYLAGGPLGGVEC